MIGVRGWLLYTGFTRNTPEECGLDYATLQRERMSGAPESVRLVAPLRGVSAPSTFVQADHSKPPLIAAGRHVAAIGAGEWAAMPAPVRTGLGGGIHFFRPPIQADSVEAHWLADLSDVVSWGTPVGPVVRDTGMPASVDSFKALHGYRITRMAIVRPEWYWAADALRARYRVPVSTV